jgi:hypothetical protein
MKCETCEGGGRVLKFYAYTGEPTGVVLPLRFARLRTELDRIVDCPDCRQPGFENAGLFQD